MAASVVDELILLESAGSLADFLSPHAHHVRQQLVRHRKLVRPRGVLDVQQPATEPRINFVKVIADGSLLGLHQKR